MRTTRLEAWKQLVGRRGVLVISSLTLVLSAATFWWDELFPNLQRPRLVAIIHAVDWRYLVIGGLGVIVVLVVEGALNLVNVKEDALQELEAATKRPKFELTHGTVITGQTTLHLANGSNEEHTHVFIPVTVYNSGAPSTIRGMTITARMKDGSVVEGERFIPGQKELVFRDLNVRFPRDQALAIKGTQNPIPHGGQCEGFVMFIFPFGVVDKLKESELNLTIIDVVNNRYPLLIDMRGTPGEMILPPSMTQKVP